VPCLGTGQTEEIRPGRLGRRFSTSAEIAVTAGKTLYLSLFLASVFVSPTCENDPESPQAKREWSVIQALEAQNSAKPITRLELVKREEFHLACFPWKNRRIWVLLDSRASPYYKQMPLENFEITDQDFQQIKGTGWANATVIECLASHVERMKEGANLGRESGMRNGQEMRSYLNI